ncbi:MAG: hypothetical protein V1871_06520 [Planctomycetota bacterium]
MTDDIKIALKSSCDLRRLFLYSLLIGYCLLIINCSYLYKKPTMELKEINMISFKMIKTADNSVIGYLEEAENMFINSGVENREKRKVYYIYDIDFNRIGFVTEQGIYKYIGKGDVTQISKGESYAIEFAIKKLLLYNGTIYYDDFEATPPWRDRY